MAEYLGPILIPDNLPSGTFPIRVRYGRTSTIAPTLAVHRFGHGDAAAEQRFILGDGATRYSFPFPKLNASEKVSLQSFYDQQQGSLIPFTVNVTMPDATVEAKICRFDGALAITQTSNVTWSATVAMVEVPQSTPTYAITKTLTRFPDSSLLTSLLGSTQEMIALLVINGNVFCSNRRCTVGGQLYQPRLADWGDVTQSIDGSADQFTFSLGNADRVISQLSRSINLYGASVQFSHFHVNTGTLLNLWSGEINDFTCSASPVATFTSGDPLWDLRKAYPVLTIDRQRGFDIPDQPVTVHSGGWAINSTSIPNDTAYGNPVPDVWCNDAVHPLPVPCTILAGRDESQYYAALGIVGRGPISGYYTGTDKQHTLDGQPHHGAGDPDISKRSFGLRRAYGGTPYTGDETCVNNQPDPGSNSFALDEVGKALPVHPLDSVAFLQIRRTDASGIQPVAVNTHTMVAQINAGLGGWVWSAPGAKSWQAGVINPIWAGVNSYLVWKSAQFASVAPGGLSDNLKSSYWYRNSSAATLEGYFDCAKAIADASICAINVTPLFARTQQVWTPAITGPPPSFPPPVGWSSGGGVWSAVNITTEQQFTFQGVIGGDGSGQARPLRDVLRDIFGACLGGFNFNFGKLRTFLRYSASVTDAFTVGNTLYQSYSESSRKPAFTRLEASFSDVDYSYQNNVLGYEDVEILAVLGKRKATVNLFGTTNKSQAARITTVRAREEMGGVGADDVLNARVHNLKTTVLALSVEPGSVISYTGPETNGATVKFRVTKWTLGKDFSVSIQGTTVTVGMYDLTYGPKPADIPPSAVPDRPSPGINPMNVLPIILLGVTYPFLLTRSTDGTSFILTGQYCPPMPIGNFKGVTVWIEIPSASGTFTCAGDFDYDGDAGALDATVWGTFAVRLPLAAADGTYWTVYVASRTGALRAPLDTVTTPKVAILASVVPDPPTSFRAFQRIEGAGKRSGICSISGNVMTRVSGSWFSPLLVGGSISIARSFYRVVSWDGADSMTLATAPIGGGAWDDTGAYAIGTAAKGAQYAHYAFSGVEPADTFRGASQVEHAVFDLTYQIPIGTPPGDGWYEPDGAGITWGKITYGIVGPGLWTSLLLPQPLGNAPVAQAFRIVNLNLVGVRSVFPAMPSAVAAFSAVSFSFAVVSIAFPAGVPTLTATSGAAFSSVMIGRTYLLNGVKVTVNGVSGGSIATLVLDAVRNTGDVGGLTDSIPLQDIGLVVLLTRPAGIPTAGITDEGYYHVPVVSGVATPDIAQAVNQEVALTANTMIAAPINVVGPITWSLILMQDATGGWIASFDPAVYRGAASLTGMLNPAPNTYSSLDFIVRADGLNSLSNMVTGMALQ